jgi:hypothetical protein
MLDNSTVDYLINYYARFMTPKESAAMKHHMTSYKFKASQSDDKAKELLIGKGWLSSDQEVLQLLTNGFEQFKRNTAERIVKDNPDKIYYNYCPNCGKLARTPQAKQCRFCGHQWHKILAATFQVGSAFQRVGRQFIILGDLLSGKIKIGMRADLTLLGLAKKPIITAIEFARQNEDGIIWEEIGLGLDELTEDDKDFLKSNSPFMTPIFIEDSSAS